MLRSKRNSPFFFINGYIYLPMKKKGENLKIKNKTTGGLCT